MSSDKRWLNNPYNPVTGSCEDSDSGLRHARAYNPANSVMPSKALDDCDEHTGRLLIAIETMCDELRAGRANEALITGVMALGEHRAYLVDHTPHLSALWEHEQDTGD